MTVQVAPLGTQHSRDLLKEQASHLWLIHMEPRLGKEIQEGVLSAEEKVKGRRFRFRKDRERYVFYHQALRNILSKYCREEPHKIDFTYNKWCKPFLKNSRFHFNFSHSNNLAVCGIRYGQALGVDVEHIHEQFDWDVIAEAFFSTEEKQHLAHLQEQDRRSAFYNIWTGKEAYGKALGLGILYPLHQVTIPVNKKKTTFIGLEGKSWTLESLELQKDKDSYVVSCVSEKLEPNSPLRLFNYNQLDEIRL